MLSGIRRPWETSFICLSVHLNHLSVDKSSPGRAMHDRCHCCSYNLKFNAAYKCLNFSCFYHIFVRLYVHAKISYPCYCVLVLDHLWLLYFSSNNKQLDMAKKPERNHTKIGRKGVENKLKKSFIGGSKRSFHLIFCDFGISLHSRWTVNCYTRPSLKNDFLISYRGHEFAWRDEIV